LRVPRRVDTLMERMVKVSLMGAIYVRWSDRVN